MEELQYISIGILPYDNLKKVSDLIAYEGPLLSHYKDSYDRNVLFFWVDFNGIHNRWLVFEVSEKQLYFYILGYIPLRVLIEEPLNNTLFTVDINSELEYENIKITFSRDLLSAYIPEPDSFFKFSIPSIYLSKLEKYEEALYHQKLKDVAFFIKLEPVNKTHSTLVGLGDLDKFIKGVKDSFFGLLNHVVLRDKVDVLSADVSRLNEYYNALKKDFEPVIVKADISSFALGISAGSTSLKLVDQSSDMEWKKNIFEEYKKNVIEIDYNNDEQVKQILERYKDDKTRSKIYSPIFQVFKSQNLIIELTDNNFKKIKEIRPPRKEVFDLITPNLKVIPDEETFRRFAYVEIKGQKIVKTLSLFEDENQVPALSITQIKGTEKIYVLKFPIYFMYAVDGEYHTIEQEEFGIYVHGSTFDEALQAFHEEIEYIYERYNSLSDDQLTSDVKNIKNRLNQLIISQ